MFTSTSIRGITVIIIIAIAVGFALGFGFDTVTSTPAIGDVSDMEYLERANRAFIQIVNLAKPAVVQIKTMKTTKMRDPFEDFRDLFPFWEFRSPEREREEQILGSGVIVNEDGYILTNNHVIEGADEIIVYLADGRELDAKIVGRDPKTDIAVIKVDENHLPTIPLGNSDEVEVGEWVIAIGSPFGYAQTVTRGMVSAKGRSRVINSSDFYADFIQTDAAINPGNSGGALINIHGELIGINTAIATGSSFSRSNAGVGFAIPINLAQDIMNELIEKGEVERGWLGVYIQDIERDMVEKLGLKNTDGALVAEVQADSPAEEAGFQSGDVIIELDGKPVKNVKQLRFRVASTDVNKQVNITVIRDEKSQILTVKIGRLSRGEVASARGEGIAEGVKPLKGLRVRNLTSELARRSGYEGESGVIITRVEPNSPAAKKRLKPGDLIKEIDGQPVNNVREYQRTAKELKNKNKIMLFVKYQSGRSNFVMLIAK